MENRNVDDNSVDLFPWAFEDVASSLCFADLSGPDRVLPEFGEV